jgi:ubiquitin-protein ligase
MKTGYDKLTEELKFIRRKAPLASMGGSAGPIGDDLYHWKAAFVGPIGSLYEGGLYYIEMVFTNDYPKVKPKCRMRTPIYHPNINLTTGRICVDYLNDWNENNNICGIVNAAYILLSLTETPANGWNGYNSFDPNKARESKKNAGVSQSYDWSDISWKDNIS